MITAMLMATLAMGEHDDDDDPAYGGDDDNAHDGDAGDGWRADAAISSDGHTSDVVDAAGDGDATVAAQAIDRVAAMVR